MQTPALLMDGYTRITELVHIAVDGLEGEGLLWRPDPDANSIAWLVWHLSRIQDHHLSEIAQIDQVWTTGPWAAAFGLPADPEDTGHSHTSQQVAAIQPPDAATLLGYHEAVAAGSQTYLASVTPEELDRIVDDRWDPPVSAGVRIVSVLSDNIQHAGQARYLRGMLDRKES